jgi:hypothetical protein
VRNRADSGTGDFRTAPEDGRTIHLAAGDRLIVEGAVYEFRIA